MSQSPATHPPDLMHDAVGPSPELTKKNTRLTLGLVLLFLALFGGTFAVGFAVIKL